MTAARRRQRGVSAVEFALMAAVAVPLLMAVLDFALLGFAELTMQHAVREGGRYAITGQADLDRSQPQPSQQQRHLAVIERIRDQSMGLYDTVVQGIDVRVGESAGFATYDDAGAYSASMFGDRTTLVTLRLRCEWKVMTPFLAAAFPGGVYRFSVATTMRNEAF